MLIGVGRTVKKELFISIVPGRCLKLKLSTVLVLPWCALSKLQTAYEVAGRTRSNAATDSFAARLRGVAPFLLACELRGHSALMDRRQKMMSLCQRRRRDGGGQGH